MYSCLCECAQHTRTHGSALEITQWMWLLSSLARAFFHTCMDGSVLHHNFFFFIPLVHALCLSLSLTLLRPFLPHNHMYTFYIQLFILTAFLHRSLFIVSISAWNIHAHTHTSHWCVRTCMGAFMCVDMFDVCVRVRVCTLNSTFIWHCYSLPYALCITWHHFIIKCWVAQ